GPRRRRALGAEARSRRRPRRRRAGACVPRRLRRRKRTAMRVLIVLPGALGDVVRALPLLGRIRRAHPAATIGWVVEPLSAPLLASHAWRARAHGSGRSGGAAGLVAVAREVRTQRYDVALDLGRSAKSALLAAASGAGRRIGFARADAREGAWLLATERLP